jgi:hypothetical protein
LEKLDDLVSSGFIIRGTSGGETVEGQKTNVVGSGENWRSLRRGRNDERVSE